MALFQLGIPVLEDTCKALEADIEAYARIATEAKSCFRALTEHGWEGKARNRFVETSEAWYMESMTFVGDLTKLYQILCLTLQHANELNSKALALPGFLGGAGGIGSKNILTYNSDSQETIDYCHRKLQDDYEEVWNDLERGQNELLRLEYAKSSAGSLLSGAADCIRELTVRKERLSALQSEFQSYSEGIRELEEEAFKVTSSFQMPEGWNSRMVELTRKFEEISAKNGELNGNWVEMQAYLEEIWDSLSETERAVLLSKLGKSLAGKEVYGVEDPLVLLSLAALEEKGYLVISDHHVTYEVGYIDEQLARMGLTRETLGSVDLNQLELGEIKEVLGLMFDETMYQGTNLTRADGNHAEELILMLHLVENREEIRRKLGKDPQEYDKYITDRFVMLELWQDGYREKFAMVDAMSTEERLKQFPLGMGNPKNEFLFMDQLEGFTAEQRLELLEIGKSDGTISREKLAQVLGVEEVRGDVFYSVMTCYRASLVGVDHGTFISEGYAGSINDVMVTSNSFLLPQAIESVYANSNPKSNSSNLDKNSKYDKMEYESIYGPEQGPNAVSGIVKDEGPGNPKDVNIHGKINSELDEVDLANKVIYEDKNASKLYMENPDYPQTEVQWAETQIYKKGKNRIEALQQPEFTLSSKTSLEMPSTESLKGIEDFVFRIDADTPELRAAVQSQMDRLTELFPNYNFSAIYGGGS